MKQSPTVQKTNFFDALANLLQGSKVTRLQWDGKAYLFMRGGVLHIHWRDENADFTLTVTEADMLATDWVTV